MRCNLRIFLLGFFCVLMLVGTGIASAGSVTFFVEVAPGFAISLDDTLTFPQASPGDTVEAELDVTIWSNVGWELMVSATAAQSGDGSPRSLEGGLEVLGANGVWRPLDHIQRTVRTNEPPTSATGESFSVPFRFQAGFGDPPGTYTIQVEFTVVPEL